MSMSLTIPLELIDNLELTDIANLLINNNEKLCVLVQSWRFADCDGLGSSITILKEHNYFKSLEATLKDKKYNSVNISQNDNNVEVYFYEGYRNAEASWKFYNISFLNFKKLLKKYPYIENLTQESPTSKPCSKTTKKAF